MENKYEKRLEEVKTAFDIMLNNLGKVLTREYKVNVGLKSIYGRAPGNYHLSAGLYIQGEYVGVGTYATDKELKNIAEYVRSSMSFSSEYANDESKTRALIDVYNMAIQSIFTNILFGENMMDLKYVITKWKEEKDG